MFTSPLVRRLSRLPAPARGPSLAALGVAAGLGLAGTPARADRFTAALAAETWDDDERPLHGLALLAYDLDDLPHGARLGFEYNTDTLRVGYLGHRLSDRVAFGAQLTGEAFVAGLTTDHFLDGQSELDRSFRSSYVLGQTGLKLQVGERTWFEVEAGLRRWFFGELPDETSAALVLPVDSWSFEPRLRWTWWQLADDAAWRDRHRLFPRLRGVAVGAELGADVRDEVRAFGARDPEAFDPPDTRNQPEPFALRARQWALAGWQAHPGFRLQLSESAGANVGVDDVTRTRVGGLGPYVVPVAGMPWAHNWTEHHLAGALSAHVRVAEGIEAGPLATVVAIVDPHRDGDTDEVGVPWGVGAMVDARFGGWQVDLRGGWSPSYAEDTGKAAYSVWLGGGWVSN